MVVDLSCGILFSKQRQNIKKIEKRLLFMEGRYFPEPWHLSSLAFTSLVSWPVQTAAKFI